MSTFLFALFFWESSLFSSLMSAILLSSLVICFCVLSFFPLPYSHLFRAPLFPLFFSLPISPFPPHFLPRLISAPPLSPPFSVISPLRFFTPSSFLLQFLSFADIIFPLFTLFHTPLFSLIYLFFNCSTTFSPYSPPLLLFPFFSSSLSLSLFHSPPWGSSYVMLLGHALINNLHFESLC